VRSFAWYTFTRQSLAASSNTSAVVVLATETAGNTAIAVRSEGQLAEEKYIRKSRDAHCAQLLQALWFVD